MNSVQALPTWIESSTFLLRAGCVTNFLCFRPLNLIKKPLHQAVRIWPVARQSIQAILVTNSRFAAARSLVANFDSQSEIN